MRGGALPPPKSFANRVTLAPRRRNAPSTRDGAPGTGAPDGAGAPRLSRLFQVNDNVRDLACGALVDRIQDEDRLVGPGFGHLAEMRREILRRHRRDVVRALAGAVSDPDEHARAVNELGRVPTGAHARRVDIGAQVRETVDGVPVRAEPGVPCLDVG